MFCWHVCVCVCQAVTVFYVVQQVFDYRFQITYYKFQISDLV
jgi:hypothetical protein